MCLPRHLLIDQSLPFRLGAETTNRKRFGVCWYDAEAATVTSRPPARAAAADTICGQGSSPRRAIGVCGACCFGARQCWFQDRAGLVNRDGAGGGQGGPGPQVVVAAQQQVDRMRAFGGGRNEHPDHWPGRAAAAAISQARRPGPRSLVDGGADLAVPELHRRSTGVRPRPIASACGRRTRGFGCRRACWTYAVMPDAMG